VWYDPGWVSSFIRVVSSLGIVLVTLSIVCLSGVLLHEHFHEISYQPLGKIYKSSVSNTNGSLTHTFSLSSSSSSSGMVV